MRRLALKSIGVVLLGLLAIWGFGYANHTMAPVITSPDTERIVAKSRFDNPTTGLAYDWLDCLERYQSAADLAAAKVLCREWTAQGVTSTLFALKFGDARVPVIESRLAENSDRGPIVIDITGGPGGEPYDVNLAMTWEFIETLRKYGLLENYRGAIVKDHPEYQLMQRGFTIASLGYWGMSMRTFEVRGEIELAVEDVRLALDHYRDELGVQPPLITTSLGNHLLLGAIGQDRVENADILALVPVMDGLQHHLERAKGELAARRAAAEAEGRFPGAWRSFNIYSKSDGEVRFDHSRMLDYGNFTMQFFDKSDYPWRDVSLTAPCSQIILGRKDPRTKAYLAANDNLPPFVKVWESDHDLVGDAPVLTRAAFAGFAECLLEQERG